MAPSTVPTGNVSTGTAPKSVVPAGAAPAGAAPPSRLGQARPPLASAAPTVMREGPSKDEPAAQVKPTPAESRPGARITLPAPPLTLANALPFEPITESDFFDDDPGEVTQIVPASALPAFMTSFPTAVEGKGFPTIGDPLSDMAPGIAAIRIGPPPTPAPPADRVANDRVATLPLETPDSNASDDIGEVLLEDFDDGDIADVEPAPASPPATDSAFAGISFGDDRAPTRAATAAPGRRESATIQVSIPVTGVKVPAASQPKRPQHDVFVITGDDDPAAETAVLDLETARGVMASAPRLTDGPDYNTPPPPPPAARRVDPAAEAVRVRQLLNDARVHAARGDLSGAIQCYTDALDLRPDLGEAHLGRGHASLDLGDYSSAMSDFQRAEDLQPGSPEPHVAMGDLYYNRKEYKRAIEYYDHAIEMDGSHAMARCLRGMSHYYRKNYRQALQDLQRAVDLDPEIPNIRKYMQMVSKHMITK